MIVPKTILDCQVLTSADAATIVSIFMIQKFASVNSTNFRRLLTIGNNGIKLLSVTTASNYFRHSRATGTNGRQSYVLRII
jgi:hypothetical protein